MGGSYGFDDYEPRRATIGPFTAAVVTACLVGATTWGGCYYLFKGRCLTTDADIAAVLRERDEAPAVPEEP